MLSKEEFLGKVDNRTNEFWEIVNELYNCDSETDIENREFTAEDFDNMYNFYVNRFNNEEKITLNGEQAERFIKEFQMGDIWGLEELERILRNELQIKDNDLRDTIYDLLRFTINVNSMVAHLETFKETRIDNVGDTIFELYDNLKTNLFNEFTNNFEIYWE